MINHFILLQIGRLGKCQSKKERYHNFQTPNINSDKMNIYLQLQNTNKIVIVMSLQTT
jgi:hypothetical protein